MKPKKIVAFVFSLCALVLEILPLGAVLYFGQPEGEPIRQTFSYFSMTPFGYANFSPLFTGVLTALLVLFSLICMFSKREKLHNTALLLAIASGLLSVCPIFLGFRYYPWVAVGISLCLGVCVLCHWKKID